MHRHEQPANHWKAASINALMPPAIEAFIEYKWRWTWEQGDKGLYYFIITFQENDIFLYEQIQVVFMNEYQEDHFEGSSLYPINES